MRLLTIGIELEAIAYGCKTREKIAAAINSSLLAFGITAQAFEWLYEANGIQWVLTLDESVVSSEEHFRAITEGVELISPVFTDMDASTREAWHGQLYLVLQAAKAAARLDTNATTGYHVHVGVGRGPNHRYTLTELKKIAALVVLYERKHKQVHQNPSVTIAAPESTDKLHPPHRSANRGRQNHYVLSNRQNDHLKHLSDVSMLQRILQVPDVPSLMHLMNPPVGSVRDISTNREMPANRYYKVNFVSLNKYGTIEFRQHAGTLDPGMVCAWADFVLAFVRVAIQMSEETLNSVYSIKPPLSNLVGTDTWDALITSGHVN